MPTLQTQTASSGQPRAAVLVVKGERVSGGVEWLRQGPLPHPQTQEYGSSSKLSLKRGSHGAWLLQTEWLEQTPGLPATLCSVLRGRAASSGSRGLLAPCWEGGWKPGQGLGTF